MDVSIDRIKEALAGRYVVERPVGHGGMATVFLAEERHPPRKVAIKVMDPSLSDRLGRGRFIREIEIVSTLTHPHIVPIFSAGEADGFFFYVMPYIAGHSLRQHLAEQGSLGLHEALHVAHDVADALDYAHEHGIVHRDIKPENIMLAGGHAMVTDFGIARALHAAAGRDAKLTVAGLPLGTPGYMSPEQATGSAEIDSRSDTYSLACVLYEMLYGEPPGANPSSEALTQIHRRRAADRAATVDTVPKTIDRALFTALSWNPGDRFTTTREFARALAGGGDTPQPHTAMRFATTPAARPPARSIAVIPFDSLSTDPENEYFADGVTEDIITQLSKIRGLKVTSRTSVMRYKGGNRSLREIGSELGVATVLEGSVRRAGGRVRVTAQLIDVESDAHLWAETYDRDLTDIFEIQSDVASNIAEELRATLTPGLRAELRRRPTEDMEAYTLYLRGVHYSGKLTLDTSQRALRCFHEAVERDPQFTLAYLGLANTYLTIGMGVGPMSPPEAFRQAKIAAERALAIDDSLIEARGILGSVHTWWDWDWEAAEDQFERANASCTECQRPYVQFGFYLAARGYHEEAIHDAKVALDLDPVSQIVNTHLAMQYYWARDFDRATEQIVRTLELERDSPPALYLLGWIHTFRGQHDDAIDAVERALDAGGRISPYLAGLGCALAAAGRADDARAVLAEMETARGRQYVSPRDLALVHACLGEDDEAIHYLERAYEEHAPWMSFLAVDPMWDRLRDDPRFTAIVRKMGLAPPQTAAAGASATSSPR